MDDDGTDAKQVLFCERGGRPLLRRKLETVIHEGKHRFGDAVSVRAAHVS
jgi:hypothetical protein